MLSGVAFLQTPDGDIQPHFVNQYVLTDVYQFAVSTPSLRIPLLPSITTLIDPLSKLPTILGSILRTSFFILLSHLPGSSQAIKKISVANTAIIYHDGRALATGESGPPMRVALPSLKTIGWFNGHIAEGETENTSGHGSRRAFGDDGLLAFVREWTTAHPRADPRTKELLLFHSTFVPPYVRYSIIPEEKSKAEINYLVNVPVPGITSPKMMHDFGVSSSHTIILDLPLSLAPQNLLVNRPVVSFDTSSASRFGVFPRYEPSKVRWFETKPCCIFHTANAWDSPDAVHLLVCRLTSASLVFSAGDLPTALTENEECRLYYYQFSLHSSSIAQEWALLSLPFEFPSVAKSYSMDSARYVYGCSSSSTFTTALGRTVKIDALVRVDVQKLIARGISNPPCAVTGCVDNRSMDDIVASTDPDDPIRVFKLPEGWYAQEPRFVSQDNGNEEDGWLLTYVFDEQQLQTSGEIDDDAVSELWIIDAKRMSEGMRSVIARVKLPQRVPYGLHGSWFTKEEIAGQRPWNSIRSAPVSKTCKTDNKIYDDWWVELRRTLLSYIG